MKNFIQASNSDIEELVDQREHLNLDNTFNIKPDIK